MLATTSHQQIDADIPRIAQRLSIAYAGRRSTAQVAAAVAKAAGDLATSRVWQYVPILIERMARDALDQPD